jgi:hypothetical protein
MKTLVKIAAYILLAYGLVGAFLLRAPVAYLAIAIAVTCCLFSDSNSGNSAHGN